MNKKLLQEIKNAYADCWMTNSVRAHKTRKLDFRASSSVSRDEAFAIMKEVLRGHGYNAFNHSLIMNFPEDAKIFIAREGSVCLYIQANFPTSMERVLADEMDTVTIDGVEWERYWWD